METTERDNLHPEMPRIPGVNDGTALPEAVQASSQTALTRALFTVLILSVLGFGAWMMVRRTQREPTAQEASTSAAEENESSASPAQQATPSKLNVIGSLEQLAAPWAYKKFVFTNPVTHEEVPAILIHVPVAVGSRTSGYWAFSLNAPFERCQLEYTTNLALIASQYGYRASHPMVVAPCDGTVYDPLQVDTSGAWVRGAVVQGGGIRPPLQIDVKIEGHSLIADKME